jgi:hypothetical protein
MTRHGIEGNGRLLTDVCWFESQTGRGKAAQAAFVVRFSRGLAEGLPTANFVYAGLWQTASMLFPSGSRT